MFDQPHAFGLAFDGQGLFMTRTSRIRAKVVKLKQCSAIESPARASHGGVIAYALSDSFSVLVRLSLSTTKLTFTFNMI
jgi:hypothetical protein